MQFSYFGAAPTVANIASPLGTKAELAAWIRDNLITAGWSVLSGAGTGVVKLRSAVTPHGLRCRLQINDTTDANSVKLYGITDDELSQATGSFLFPTAGFNWKLVATPYYAHIFRDIASVQNRDWFSIQNLYIPQPDRGAVTEAFITNSNSTTVGSDGSINGHFRNVYSGNNTNDRYIAAFNSNRWLNGGANVQGTVRLVTPAVSKFWDNSFVGTDIWLQWGTPDASAAGLLRGIWPDAFMYGDALPYGTTWNIDGHNWFCITFGTAPAIFIMIS